MKKHTKMQGHLYRAPDHLPLLILCHHRPSSTLVTAESADTAAATTTPLIIPKLLQVTRTSSL